MFGVDKLKTQGPATGANDRAEVCNALTLEVLVGPLARVLVVNVVDHKLDPLDSLEAIVDLESLDKDRVQVVLDTLCGRVRLLGPLARVWVLEEHEHLRVTERDGILVLEFSNQDQVKEKRKTRSVRYDKHIAYREQGNTRYFVSILAANLELHLGGGNGWRWGVHLCGMGNVVCGMCGM